MTSLLPILVFLSAFLLFWLELWMAKSLLPDFGGSPSVWNYSLFFFQTLLFLAYGYVHWLSQQSPKKQSLVHGPLILSSLAVLPLTSQSLGDLSLAPQWQLLATLGVRVGLPFFVLSCTTPLVQVRLTYGDQPAHVNPYQLFAASNLGSLAAVLGAPLLLDLTLGLKWQSWLWTGGFLMFLGLMAWASSAWPARALKAPVDEAPVTWSVRGQWMFISAVGAMLLHTFSHQMSLDWGAHPLFWMLPLALYLGSFSVAFARDSNYAFEHLGSAVMPLLIAPLILMALPNLALPPAVAVVAAGYALFVYFALNCYLNRCLFRRRPEESRLTEFYLCVAAGGWLGGLFEAVCAPLIFHDFMEGCVLVVIASMVIQGDDEGQGQVALLTFGLLATVSMAAWYPGIFLGHALAAVFALALLGGYHLLFRPHIILTLAEGLLLVGFLGFAAGPFRGVQDLQRGFFGVHRIVAHPSRPLKILLHGTTVHGQQSTDPAQAHVPLAYYHPTGPAGQVFELLVKHDEQSFRDVAVLGLGVGNLGAYSSAKQTWDFYEIDPLVVHIARDSGHFSFLSDMPARSQVILGDARQSLAKTERRYDLMVVDCFGSDSIPVHLLTEEAFGLYSSRLRGPGSLLLLHISHRHFDLEPMLAALAQSQGMEGLACLDTAVSKERQREGKSKSHWVLLGRSSAALQKLSQAEGWRPLRRVKGLRAWTDDRSSLLSLVWHGLR